MTGEEITKINILRIDSSFRPYNMYPQDEESEQSNNIFFSFLPHSSLISGFLFIFVLFTLFSKKEEK